MRALRITIYAYVTISNLRMVKIHLMGSTSGAMIRKDGMYAKNP